jgi:ribosome-interacting GTPase 1
LTIEEIEGLAHQLNTVVTSVMFNVDLKQTWQKIFKMLDMTLGSTMKACNRPDFEEAVLLRRGKCPGRDVCIRLHRNTEKNLRAAQMWGTSGKRMGQ